MTHMLVSLILVAIIAIPSMLILLLQGFFYRAGRKCRKTWLTPCPDEIRSSNKRPLVSIIIPVRKEPLEYIDEALRHISGWSISDKVEVIIVSDDDRKYAEKIKSIVDKWRKTLRVIFIWRSEPKGYRTGALNTGLWASTGKAIYIMDVDSRVSESFILKGLHLIENGAFAAVGRWRARNTDSRLSEAIACAMNYVVDSIYRGRACLGLPVFPIGTGTIYDAERLKNTYNGWDEERIQDDMELGARIMYHGDKIEYIDDESVLVEVPRRFRSFRIQQERWAYGTMDVVISRFKHILFSKQSPYARLDAFLYLLQYLPLLITLFAVPPVVLLSLLLDVDPFLCAWPISAAWCLSALFYLKNYIDAARDHGFTLKSALINGGRASAATVALTPSVTKGMLLAMLRRKLVYKRTPKGSHERSRHSSGLRFPWELFIGALTLSLSILLLIKGIVFTSFWLLTYSLGYIYSFIRWPRDILFK